jgi:hypothetical protein
VKTVELSWHGWCANGWASASDRPLRLLDVERALLKAALTGAPLGFTIGEQSKREGDRAMADILYLGVTVAFFGLSWLLVRLCERL